RVLSRASSYPPAPARPRWSLSSTPALSPVLFFFSLLPPPPSSTLFPYTTLFRSGLLAPRAVALLRRRLRWRAFVIPHTHWDREWYERFEGYRARLVPMVSKLLDILERDPEFRSFTFDGQTIAIQDYLEKRPADQPRVQALVKADRLLIGPWHVLADLLLVSGESIVRNLQE